MTEREYVIYSIGRRNHFLRELQYIRKLCWTMVCGYADPVKLPPNERTWWPLENDPLAKPLNRKKVIKLHNKIMQLKFEN